MFQRHAEECADQFFVCAFRQSPRFGETCFKIRRRAERIEAAVQKIGRPTEKLLRFPLMCETVPRSVESVRRRVARRAFSRATSENEDFESGVAPEPVASVQTARGFPRGEQTRHASRAVGGDADSSERGVRTRFHFKPEFVEHGGDAFELQMIFRIFRGESGFIDAAEIVADSSVFPSVSGADFPQDAFGELPFARNVFSRLQQRFPAAVQQFCAFVQDGCYDREAREV